eukprot:14415615-Alexandrium_andersonii.AAC.1
MPQRLMHRSQAPELRQQAPENSLLCSPSSLSHSRALCRPRGECRTPELVGHTRARRPLRAERQR